MTTTRASIDPKNATTRLTYQSLDSGPNRHVAKLLVKRLTKLELRAGENLTSISTTEVRP